MRFLWLIFGLWPGLAQAADWTEPARGTADRSAMMDAMRPHAEWILGAPIQFIVHDLRRAGDVGFATLSAQRPGGASINLRETPGYALGEIDMEAGDPREFIALYRRVGQTWVAVHWSSGATDAWFVWQPLCSEYRPVIAEYCDGF